MIVYPAPSMIRNRWGLKNYVGRMTICAFFLIIGGLTTRAATAKMAQDSTESVSKVGLALSGGGAKGLAHIGVLKVIDEVGLPITAISGTSVGSIVGGLYAMGYSPQALTDIAGSMDWNTLFSDAIPRRNQSAFQKLQEQAYILSLPVRGRSVGLPSGLIEGQQVFHFLSRLGFPYQNIRDFRRFPIPFACVATDLETGEGVRLDSGYWPEAIRASMSIPTVFTPVKIGERTYVDGMVARNLPAEDARALGADFVICVDVGEPLAKADSLKSLLEILDQSINLRNAASKQKQRELCDIIIEPAVMSYSNIDFDSIDEFITAGELAADGYREQLVALTDTVERVSPRTSDVPSPKKDSVYVTGLVVEGVGSMLTSRVHAALELETPGFFRCRDLEEAVERVYSTQLFKRVTYRLDVNPEGNGSSLQVFASPRELENIGVGLRYEDQYGAAILLSARLRDRFGAGSVTDVYLTLGENFRLGAAYNVPLSSRIFSHTSARLSRTTLDLFEAQKRISSLRVNLLEIRYRLHRTFFDQLIASAGVQAEISGLEQAVGVTSFFQGGKWVVSGLLMLDLDTFDKKDFPSRGHILRVKSILSSRSLTSNLTFSQHVVDWQARFPVRPSLTFMSRLTLGYMWGRNTPLYYRFHMGGALSYGIHPDRYFPLWGYSVHQLQGKSIQFLELGAQYRLSKVFFAQFRMHLAYVGDSWQWNLAGPFEDGYGVGIGAQSRLGPIELILVSRDLSNAYSIRFNVGYVF